MLSYLSDDTQCSYIPLDSVRALLEQDNSEGAKVRPENWNF